MSMRTLSIVNVIDTAVSLDACLRLSRELPTCLVTHSETKAVFGEHVNAHQAIAAWLNHADIDEPPATAHMEVTMNLPDRLRAIR